LQRNGLLEAAVLASLLLVSGSTWVFVEIADGVHEGEARWFDESVLHALRRSDNPALPIGPYWVSNVARDLTALGSAAVIVVISLGAAGFLVLRRKWGALWLIIASIAGGAVVSTALKSVFERPRPDLVPHLDQVSSLSFPSGHSMLSAVTYLTLGALLARTTTDRRIKTYFLVTAGAVAVIVGLTRIYLGVHFPTDVLAGWCAGIVWALLCSLVARWLQREGAVERETPPSAGSGA
jgi:undecaprenyl-diphosphatase